MFFKGFSETGNAKTPMLVIEPPEGWSAPSFREIWQHRELLFYLTWRDLKVRYKQTALGIGWVIIPPIFNMLVISIIFGGLAKLPSEGVPYAIFAFAGLVPWGLFSRALTGAGNSLLSGAGLSAKVYFPRLTITFSSVLSSLVDSGITLVVLFGMLLWFGVSVTWSWLALVFFSALALLTALGVGVWLAALSVQFRDVAQLSSLLLTVWMYASPVVYSSTLLPGGVLRTLYWLNPMAIVVQGFRWSVLGSPLPPLSLAIVSMTGVLLALVSGLYYFQRVERTFIDLV
jgi:lipopolysaccharide transport system permease protein